MQGFRRECGKFKANLPGGQHVRSESLNLSHRAVTSSSGSPGCRQAPALVNNEQPHSLPGDAPHLSDASLGGQRVARVGSNSEGCSPQIGGKRWGAGRVSGSNWGGRASGAAPSTGITNTATQGEPGQWPLRAREMMPLLGFLGVIFLQIMVLLLFAGSGIGRMAEDLYRTGCPARGKKPPGHP